MHVSGFDDSATSQEYGYDFRVRKSGDVDITLNGRTAATLRGAQAKAFIAQVEGDDDEDSQQELMARMAAKAKRSK
jgi:uncharacterized protein YhbP (UPF0306 family)